MALDKPASRSDEGGTRLFHCRTIRTQVIALLVLLGAALPAGATVHYVDAIAGNDANPGTTDQPWKTLNRVQSDAAEGDTVFIQQADEALCAAAWPDRVSYRAGMLKQFGITWQFDDYYAVGRFANGDFWVVGPVNILTIEPKSTEINGRVRHGSMVNPDPRNDSIGYDNQVCWVRIPYDAALNVAFDLSPERPLTLQPHSSLVSSISVDEPDQRPQIKQAAVLTVLQSPAPRGSFRPPYCGTDKTLKFDKSMLDYSLLRRLPPVGNTPSLQTVADYFAAPWIDHVGGWRADYTHPALNMPHYGREMHMQIGTAALMLHLDFEPAEKETLLIRYVQLGIDLYGIVAAGGTKNWANDGGITGGRKWPILFAGIMLNDPQMKAIGQQSGDYLYQNGFGPGNPPPDYVHFGEDDQTFYVSEFDIALTNSPKFAPDPRNAERIPYSESDLGLPEWGVRHATAPELSNKWLPTNYRVVAGPPFPLTALAALLTEGGKALWNHNAYFDYTDRYQAFTAADGEYSGWWSGIGSFGRNMWDTYRAQCGPIWPQTDNPDAPKLSLIGDRQVMLGQTLTFTINATDANGDTLAYTTVGLPNGATFSEKTFTWAPTSNDLGNHQITFTVSDGSTEDSETVTITVERPNAAPVLSSIGDKSTSENQALSFSITATDPDGDPLTYSASGVPSGASFTGQTFTWTPGYTQAGVYNVTFTVSDGRAQDSRTVAISVANINRPPALAAVGDRSVDEDNTLTFTLSGTDPDGTELTYSATGLPTGAQLAGANFTWTPGVDQTGSHEITFAVSDGASTDTETITVMVVSTSTDNTAPTVARHAPAPDAIQVPLNNLITLHVTDAGKGVKADSVRITVDGNVVYQGDTPAYASAFGQCRRSGVRNDYEFVYQHNQMFDFDHEVTVTVDAADRAGNMMNQVAYSFATEMRAFGSNKCVSRTGAAAAGRPATVADAAGNIWAAWHAGAENARDIYVARLSAGEDAFEAPTRITTDPGDQCNPDLALAADGSLHVVWQDNRRGHWDIFGSTSLDGRTFTKETLITSDDENQANQTDPTVVVAGPSDTVWVAWQDNRNGNQDIYVASSTNAFAAVTATRVTTDPADQTEPDLAFGDDNVIYLVWTDRRAGQADIYGAASTTSWANAPLVAGAGNQTCPAIAASGSTLHLLWMDEVSGDSDIFYASSNGLPADPVRGADVIDDTSGAAQTAPALACTADGKVFACWQDLRNVGIYGDDADVYFAELSPGTARTNVLLGDNGADAGQSEPAIAVSAGGQPYVVWTDDRDAATEIYCAATTYIDPDPMYSAVVSAGAAATIGTAPAAIAGPADVSIVVPAGACQTDVRMTISRILNPLLSPSDCLGSYDFGPSGVDFDEPVTVTIPYQVAEGGQAARAYWYDSLTGALSQQGIADVENVRIGGNLYALRFKTTHFTPFYLVAADSKIIAYTSVNGTGCSLSASGSGSPEHLLVPYVIVVVFMAILRHRDRRRAVKSTEL